MTPLLVQSTLCLMAEQMRCHLWAAVAVLDCPCAAYCASLGPDYRWDPMNGESRILCEFHYGVSNLCESQEEENGLLKMFTGSFGQTKCLLDRSRVSVELGVQLRSTCSVTGVADGAGGSGAKSK